jgi:hypothetical protein
MDGAKRGSGQQSARKRWRCHECGATGVGWTFEARSAALLAHWAANHQEVPF